MTTKPARNLLVVDDEPEILSEVVAYLRRRGETVVAAASFTEAMQTLSDDTVPIDILITDGRMPDGSGIDLLKAALGRSCRPQSLIMMTGHFEESDLTPDLKEAGVIIVNKPFSLGALYRELGAAAAPRPPAAACQLAAA
jgi:two-component system response regulator PilR (NtrC family)